MKYIILAASAAFALLSVAAQAQTLSRAEILAIEAECAALEKEHTAALDAHDGDRVARTFGESGEMRLLLGTFKGEAAIKAYMADRAARKAATGVDATRHTLANITVDVIDRDRAKGRAYIVVYRYNPREPAGITLAPDVVGDVRSEYVRTAEGWRYASRQLLRAAAPAPVKP